MKKVFCDKTECFACKKGVCSCLTKKALHQGECSFFRDRDEKRKEELRLYGYSEQD